MYSVLLMVAMTGAADAPAYYPQPVSVSCYGCAGCYGCSGCYGTATYSSCYGCAGCYGCSGCSGVVSGYTGCYGCSGCTGCYGGSGCYGTVTYGSRHGCTGCYGGSGYSGVVSGYTGCYGCSGCTGTIVTPTYYSCSGCSGTIVSPISYSCGGCFGCSGGHVVPSMPKVEPKTDPKVDPKVNPKVEPKKPEARLNSAPATLVVNVPADAQLSVDGVKTEATTGRRVFISPTLAQGKDFVYNLSIEVLRDGKSMTVTKEAVVRAGEETTVRIEDPSLVAKR